MTLLCCTKWLASQALTPDEFEHLCQNAEILEQDVRGVKVLRLTDGNMLKIFRVKRLLSGARLYSYARRFCRNAERLHKLGIPTVRIGQLLRFTDSSNSAVIYQPLPGLTLRQLLTTERLTPELTTEIGRFIARLHDLGVYFRSLHLGNIILTPDDTFGLIDIADMSVYRRSLRWNERRRNFRHLHRYHDDIRQMGMMAWQELQRSYLNDCKLSLAATEKLSRALQRFDISRM